MAKKYSKKKKKAYSEEVSAAAIAIVRGEKSTWEDSVMYVTEKVAFNTRNLIRTCIKNYWGVFDQPIDPITGRNKIWYPLSEEAANSWADLSDLDTKDFGFRSRPGGSYALTQLTRQIMKDYLDQTNFGQELDDNAFEKSITGTSVTKVLSYKVNGKNKIFRNKVSLLNFYIDPTADNIQDAYRVTERALMYPDEIAQMTGWKNTKNLQSGEALPKNDPDMKTGSTEGNVKSRDVYEMWGKIPKWIITGEKKDKESGEEIDGHIVVSGLEAPGAECHIIEQNKKKDKEGNIIKPYEEDWAMKVPGRWYGRGPVEQLMLLQVWINTIINIRINRSYVSQLGLWKIRRGSNITPKTIQKLGSNGAVLVQSMDDIEQMVMQDASQASYTDEQNIRDIAKRVTRTLETVTGEQLPASMTATATSIQASSSKTPFTKIKERAGFWGDRLINRHLMPLVMENASKGQIIRILNEDQQIDEIVERVAFHYVDKLQSDLELQQMFLNSEQLQIAIQSAKEQLRQKPEIFFKNLEDLVSNLVDATVYISNEELDMGSTVDKLVMGANLLPEQDRKPMVRTIYDTLGMPYPPELQFSQNQQAIQEQGQPQEIANTLK